MNPQDCRLRANYMLLMKLTSSSSCERLDLLGNLSSHMSKLEEAEYIEVRKEFLGRKPNTVLRMTSKVRTAFDNYQTAMRKVLKEIPE